MPSRLGNQRTAPELAGCDTDVTDRSIWLFWRAVWTGNSVPFQSLSWWS
jgi:hypothetical protein